MPKTNNTKVQVNQTEEQEQLNKKIKEIKNLEIEKEAKTKADALHLQHISLEKFPIGQKALELISEEDSLKYKVVSFLYAGEEIRLGAVNPLDKELKEFIKSLAERNPQKNIVVYLISENSLEYAQKMYAKIPKVKKIPKGVSITEEDLLKFKNEISDYKELDQKIKHVSITDLVTLIIAASLQAEASDIHIEFEQDKVNVKFRIDGILHLITSVEKDVGPKITSRLKLLAGLKINISDKPQDGRFTIFLTNDFIDVRVSTLPTSFGESIVMRLLMSSKVGIKFSDLGIGEYIYDKLEKQISRPNGMVITTGPTGSGKTTTLYAILNQLNDGKKKIITLEDPIEYKLAGISQSQMDQTSDYTFAKGLRSILRQDPDVIMVGEIRDFETADTAINAALTGHLVLSTVHTNSASGAVPRFLAMGVKSFLLAPALNSVIGQRLVRKLCPHCKQEDVLDEPTKERVEKILKAIPENSGVKVDMANLKFYKPIGCDKCIEGYKGRVGIYEILIMTKEIEKVILSQEISEYVMNEIAVKNGMVSMVQDGLIKALAGKTSLEEVFREATEE